MHKKEKYVKTDERHMKEHMEDLVNQKSVNECEHTMKIALFGLTKNLNECWNFSSFSMCSFICVFHLETFSLLGESYPLSLLF